MPQRYKQLNRLIAEVRPHKIVEIGTHRAKRASHIAVEAMKYHRHISYLGFDIFDDGDAGFQEAALNDKAPPSYDRAVYVMHKLEKYCAKNRSDGSFSWALIKGDTRQTLCGKDIVADFVFIDGDHRLATIRSDYAAVRGSKCVVFDDYFLPGLNGELPNLDQYGANRLIDEMPVATLLPAKDRAAKRGWYSVLAVVMNP